MRRNRLWFIRPLNIPVALACVEHLENNQLELHSAHAPKPVKVYPCSAQERKDLERNRAQMQFEFQIWTKLEGEKKLRLWNPRAKRSEAVAEVGKFLRRVKKARHQIVAAH